MRREADIAVRMVRPTQGALLSQKIGSVRLGFYAHRRYVERHGMPTTIPELLKRPLIGFDRRPTVSPTALSGKIEVTRDLFAFRADNDLACLAALRAGFGIGVCQELLAARDPDLLPFGHDVLDINLPIWLVMHEDLKGVRRMRLMFDHLVQGLRAYLAGEPI
jgi:DNA-binding transcriptional LysR family regulator